MPLIELDPEDGKNAQELDDGITGDIYKRVEMPFNSLTTEFFETSDINDLIQRMLTYIKAQTENPKFPESGFTLDKIMLMMILRTNREPEPSNFGHLHQNYNLTG